MFDKLDFIEEKYESLGMKISEPEVISDHKLWLKLSKEYASITPVVEKYREYKLLFVHSQILIILFLLTLMFLAYFVLYNRRLL